MTASLEIQTGFVETNGIRLHYAEAGTGPAVILCHGFPELWRSWRYQIPVLAAAGYRAVALDMRGHGLSDAPEEIGAYTVMHTVGDVIGLMDALGIEQATLVGHDAGTTTAYGTALMRPERVRGVAGLSVPFRPRAQLSPAVTLLGAMPPGFYMGWFQEPGAAERDLERDPRETLLRLFFHNSGENAAPTMMFVPPGEGLIAQLAAPVGPVSFISDTDLDAYARAYAQSGFRGGLNGYRVIDTNWQLTAPWAGATLTVPSLFVGGSKDSVLQFPGFREAAEAMDQCLIIDGVGHWVQAERPDEVNAALLGFVRSVAI